MKINTVGMGLALAALCIAGMASAGAQAPEDAPQMMPHRPPMERAMGPMGGMRGDHGRWWNEPHLVEKLKLTDSQRKAMDDLYQQHRLTLVPLHASLEKEELTLEPMVQADQPDENKILAQIDRVAQARAELEKANARMLLDLRQQLTPEQWKALQAERAARRAAGPSGGPMFRGPRGAGSGTGPGTGSGPVPGPGGPPPNPDGSGGPGAEE
jgi:Spy/CpxP family protein refolding chaperone